MKRIIVSIFAMLMVLSQMTGCTKKEEPKPAEPVRYEVRLGVLKGPTGIGASYLLERNANDESLNKYAVTVDEQPANMVSMIASGELDIAAVPTNVASTLYNKTNGGVKIIALNTAGVLYVLEKGDTIHSVEDLKGKKISMTGQGANPEYVFNYILEKNGLKPNEDLFIEFLDSATITASAASGGIEVCLLPVPAVTTVLVKNQEYRKALNLTEEWNKIGNGSVLTMGCVVVRTEFYENNKEAVEQFLKEYEESINYVKNNPAEAGEFCAKYEIVPAAAIASKAIPDANLIFVSGKDIKPAIEGYYQVLFDADPKSIGGKMPGDDFYPGE